LPSKWAKIVMPQQHSPRLKNGKPFRNAIPQCPAVVCFPPRIG
jgi:hypothetical protein